MIYVPVLRLKQSEWLALRELRENEKNAMTPILEPTLWYFDTQDHYEIDAGIQKTTKNLFKSWGSRKAFIDPYIIEHRTDIRYFIDKFFGSSLQIEISLIPVIRLKSSKAYLDSLRTIYNNHEIALRLQKHDLSSPDFHNKINSLLNALYFNKKDTHLIYDYQILDQTYPEIYEIAEKIQDISAWKSFIILGGSFPQYASQYTIDLHNIERKEWSLWLNALNGKKPARIPIFGDYTIQYPIYSEPPKHITPSASVRYTTEKNWLLLRGESLKKGAKHGQYPAHALMLKERDEFYGKDFSYGDKYIFEMAEKMENEATDIKTGNPPSWLKAGINHHLAVVIHQIANLNVT